MSRWHLSTLVVTAASVLGLTLVIFSSFDRRPSSEDPVVMESSDMATIDKMLSHIHKLTKNYQPDAGSHASHKHHKEHAQSSSSSHPSPSHHLATSIKHHQKKAAALRRIATHHHKHSSSDSHHHNKALEEAESAEAHLKRSGTGNKVDSSAEKKKRAEIAAKMKALQAKINHDFTSVMRRGKSAGYLPPIQMPHM